MSLRSILIELKAAIPSQSIAVVGEIYQRLEAEAVSSKITGTGKPHQMQLMRKYLMQQNTGEMMRINTGMNTKQLAEFDINAEIDQMIAVIDNA